MKLGEALANVGENVNTRFGDKDNLTMLFQQMSLAASF